MAGREPGCGCAGVDRMTLQGFRRRKPVKVEVKAQVVGKSKKGG